MVKGVRNSALRSFFWFLLLAISSALVVQLAVGPAFASTKKGDADTQRAQKNGFSGIAKTPLQIKPHGPDRCDLYFFAAESTDDLFEGLSGDFHAALFPQEAVLDGIMSRYANCGTRYFSYSVKDGGLARIFPGRTPYFVDPFADGVLQQQLSAVEENFDSIGVNDGLTEHAIWQHISAIQSYVAVSKYAEKLNKMGVRNANFHAKRQLPFPKGIVVPTEQELQKALKVARGAQVRVFRALLWQYGQMKNAPYFSIEQCTAYGAAFEGLGRANFDEEATTAHFKADELLRQYESEFYIKALPHAMASFGQIAPILQSWDEIGNTLNTKVYQETESYSCLTDQSQFLQNVANQRFREIRDTKVALEQQALNAEVKRRSDASKAAAARNARAGSGDFAPVADDLVRALINAQRKANAQGIAAGAALFGKNAINDQFDYEDGLYVEDYAVQKNSIQHFVKSPTCTRVSKIPVVYDCSYDVRFDITVAVFGLSLPKLSVPFVRHQNRFEFTNGSWGSESLAKGYAEQRAKAAASASSYDHAKGSSEFHCISSNNFADRFGLVRNIGC